MSEASANSSFSLGRVLLVVVPLGLVGWAAKMYSSNLQTDAKLHMERSTVSQLLSDQLAAATLAKKYTDADGDLVADPPSDPAKRLDPKELNFSYIASGDSEDAADTWKELFAALESKLGRKVNFVSYADRAEQMRALEKGDLHLTAFSTGEVQGAVNEAGFVPTACFADKDGKYHYTMKIIVPADSDVKDPKDLRGKRLIFTRPQSNSGCTAAVVMLMKEQGLQPERDYGWGFSYGHENSIKGVAQKKFPAASVASDILDRMTASGVVPPNSVREIYESKPYPPAVVGYAYNLTPQLRDGIRETLLGFEWKGTGLEKTFGSSGNVKCAPVSYKDDWAPVREISKAGREFFAQLNAN